MFLSKDKQTNHCAALDDWLFRNNDNGSSQTVGQETRLVQDYLCGQFRINSFQDVLEGLELSPEEQRAMKQMKTWLNDDLNAKRNKVMGRRVVELLTSGSGTSQFFALGLGHYLGERTIVEEVREAGFLVERVRVGDDLGNWRHTTGSGAERAALNINILCCLGLVLSYTRFN